MGKHFVPKFYLRGFETDGAIWAYDKQEDRTFKTQVGAIANENGMYPDGLESWLATNVEDPAKGAITKIRNRSPITSEEKRFLAKYILTLWKRVPRARARVAELMPSVVAEVHGNLIGKLEKLVVARPDLNQKVDKWRAQVTEVIARHQANPPLDIWLDTIESDTANHVVDALTSMRWAFLYRNDAQFLTCDNPVFFFEFEGIGKTMSELTIPMSSSVVLWASRRHLNENQFVQAMPSAVREINRRMAHNSTRFLYFERNESWIPSFARKGNWKLNRLQ